MGVLTGGVDRPYVFGLTMALAAKGVQLDVIGSKEVDGPAMHSTPGLNFLDLQADPREQVNLARKILRLLVFYLRLFRYAATAKPRIFHILWNNKVQLFDRTLLMLYYKLLGKKVVLTAHNVNAGKRDGNDSFLNRLTLKIQYRLADHIFVHTELMKRELLEEFGVKNSVVTVIPFGINNSVPNSKLTPAEAKQVLGIKCGTKTILFFGSIRPYKGLVYLISAFKEIAERDPAYRLVIAGERRKESEKYWDEIQRLIGCVTNQGQVIQRIEYIPDEQTELYFKAADVLALPYTHVFQSGVLFLAHSFGLPVIATDVGSIREDIVEGKTGFLCRPCDSSDLAGTIDRYFESPLLKDLDRQRQEIQKCSNLQHSWDVVSEKTMKVYRELVALP